jgi:hypothetical protein
MITPTMTMTTAIIIVNIPGNNFINVILQAMNLAIPWVSIRKSEFPWFLHSLRYCIQKEN